MVVLEMPNGHLWSGNLMVGGVPLCLKTFLYLWITVQPWCYALSSRTLVGGMVSFWKLFSLSVTLGQLHQNKEVICSRFHSSKETYALFWFFSFFLLRASSYNIGRDGKELNPKSYLESSIVPFSDPLVRCVRWDRFSSNLLRICRVLKRGAIFCPHML